MTILVTGFDSFDKRETNASWETAAALPPSIRAADGRVLKLAVKKLPVVYYKSIVEVLRVIEEDETITDVVLLGEAGGYSRLAVEHIGVNVDDTPMPDNEDNLRQGEPIDPHGADGLFATIPVKAVVEHLTKAAQVPAFESWSAGQYVCNHVLYGVLNGVACRAPQRKLRVGFVHLPFTSQQASLSNMPGLPLSEMTRGVEAVLAYLADNPAS